MRSFFGVFKVVESSDGRFRVLPHGTTMHGAQRIRDDKASRSRAARAAALLLRRLRHRAGHRRGTCTHGTRADPLRGGRTRHRHARLPRGPDDTVHYYEIDPAAIRIARDRTLFRFLTECRPDVPIMLGDARLTLTEAPDGTYDLIIVDAFSSDAIPIHLLTREAMAIYLKKLSPHGIVVLHVSNRHLELASVVAGIAAANGLITRVNESADLDETANHTNSPAPSRRWRATRRISARSPSPRVGD